MRGSSIIGQGLDNLIGVNPYTVGMEEDAAKEHSQGGKDFFGAIKGAIYGGYLNTSEGKQSAKKEFFDMLKKGSLKAWGIVIGGIYISYLVLKNLKIIK